mgnify:CR=1 FL=1
MFEYLMPLLVMPTYENTLLDQTYLAAVERQIEYGRQRGVPWGMSESGYNTVDVHLNYQYRAFGVPGLGLKRGLGEDLVVAPYASALALMVAPEAACLNLQRLVRRRIGRKTGLIRGHRLHAVAATSRGVERGGPVVHGAPPGDEPALMRLCCFWRDRCKSASSRIRSSRRHCFFSRSASRGPRCSTRMQPIVPISASHGDGAELPVRMLTSPDTAIPEVQLLSNGRYHVMVTNAGGGSSRWKDLAVTRWREDSTSRQLGHASAIYATRRAGSSGQPPISPRSSKRNTTKRSSRRAGRSFDAETSISRRIPRSWFRPKTISRSAASASPTGPGLHGRSTSRATRRWFSRQRPRTRCIRRSAISSCKPRSSGDGTQFFAPAAHAPSKSRCRGCFT